LLNRRTGKSGTEGSNPSVSATFSKIIYFNGLQAYFDRAAQRFFGIFLCFSMPWLGRFSR